MALAPWNMGPGLKATQPYQGLYAPEAASCLLLYSHEKLQREIGLGSYVVDEENDSPTHGKASLVEDCVCYTNGVQLWRAEYNATAAPSAWEFFAPSDFWLDKKEADAFSERIQVVLADG